MSGTNRFQPGITSPNELDDLVKAIAEKGFLRLDLQLCEAP